MGGQIHHTEYCWDNDCTIGFRPFSVVGVVISPRLGVQCAGADLALWVGLDAYIQSFLVPVYLLYIAGVPFWMRPYYAHDDAVRRRDTFAPAVIVIFTPPQLHSPARIVP